MEVMTYSKKLYKMRKNKRTYNEAERKELKKVGEHSLREVINKFINFLSI